MTPMTPYLHITRTHPGEVETTEYGVMGVTLSLLSINTHPATPEPHPGSLHRQGAQQRMATSPPLADDAFRSLRDGQLLANNNPATIADGNG